MIIFEYNKTPYVYIHIPKNNGKYIRNLIRTQYRILEKFWDIDYENKLDLAHIPSCLIHKYSNITDYKTISFIRNPYDRIISAFFYKNPTKTKLDLNKFIIEELSKMIFNDLFNYEYIHYYPQTKFIDNKVELIKCEELIDNTRVGSCRLNIVNLNIRKYNYQEYFNNDTLSIINKIYYNDFILCKYEKINELPYTP